MLPLMANDFSVVDAYVPRPEQNPINPKLGPLNLKPQTLNPKP